MSQSEALSMVNLNNVSKRNKEYLFAEIIGSSKSLKKTADHVKMLETIAKCLEDITQTDKKKYARHNKDNLSVEVSYADRKRAENAVETLHGKLGLKKYQQTFGDA